MNIKLTTELCIFCQVQRQMAITKRNWYDFVIFTNKGISVQTF